jgi:hypothetical protein
LVFGPFVFGFPFSSEKYIKFVVERGGTDRVERGKKYFLEKKSMVRSMN